MEFAVFEYFGLRRVEVLMPILLLVVPWILYGVQYPTLLVQQLDHCPQLACDFTRHYLPQAQYAFEHSEKMNGGWFYPPLLAILLIPWTFLEQPEYAWTIFNISGVFLLMRRTISTSPWLLTASLCATSLPILHALKWGQISIWIALCLCVVLFEQEDKTSIQSGGTITDQSGLFRKKRTAWILGLASAIKIYPLIFVMVPLLKGRLKWVVHCVITTVVFGAVIPMMWLGEGILSYWYAIQRGQQLVVSMGPTAGGQSLAPTLHRWFLSGEFIGGQWSVEPLMFSAAPLKIFLLFGLLVFIAYRLWGLRARPMRSADVVYLLIGIHLLLQPGWVHYFAWLPIVQVWCWLRCRGQPIVRICLLGLIVFERLPLFWLNQETYFAFSRAGWMTIVVLGLLGIVYLIDKESDD